MEGDVSGDGRIALVALPNDLGLDAAACERFRLRVEAEAATDQPLLAMLRSHEGRGPP